LQKVCTYAPKAEAKWGEEGLDAILEDKSIHAVAVVLPAQAQVDKAFGTLNFFSALLSPLNFHEFVHMHLGLTFHWIFMSD